MARVLRSKTLSVSIARPPTDVYGFVSNPENLPKWATGLCTSVKRSKGGWIVETPNGPMSFRFVGPNAFGVLDHSVSPASGLEIRVPMRVVANGSGSEVLLTLFQSSGMPEEKFAEDVRLVERDLRILKDVLER